MSNIQLLISIFLICVTSTVSAQDDTQLTLTEHETIEQRMVEYSEALKLTSEQAEAMQSTLTLNLKQRNSVLSEYGIFMDQDKKANLNIREKLRLRDELKTLADGLQREIEGILTVDQMLTWSEIQTKNRETFKRQLKDKLS